MSGPLASWLQEHADPKLTAPDMDVLVTLALDANHLDRLACVAVGELARLTRHDRRTVQRSLGNLEAAGTIELARAGGGRGRPATYRIPVSFCGCVVCDTLAGLSDKKGRHPAAVSAGGFPSSTTRKGGTPSLKGGTGPPTTDGYTPATKQQRLAMQAAKLQLRDGTHPLDGDGPAEPSQVPDTSGVAPLRVARLSLQDEEDQGTTRGLPGEPREQGKQNGSPGLRPLQAQDPDAGTPGGAASTQSREPGGGATRDPVLHPREGRSDDLDVWTESDAAFWTAGEHTAWEFAQEMEAGAFDEPAEGPAELFELADYRDPRRHAR